MKNTNNENKFIENNKIDSSYIKSEYTKKIHLVKIVIFFIIILVPLVTINIKGNQISKIDNRMLTEFKDIVNTGGIENYIDDRIGFRTEMVNIYNKGMDVLFNEMVHPSYQYGEDEYVFSKVSEIGFDSRFQEVFSEFIKNFENYCNDRGIKFLYTIEPSKSTVYEEFLPNGYKYDNMNLDYFLSLLESKEVSYLNNVETLKVAKENNQVFDKKYDAGHWNETGAVIGISAILDKLNLLDNRVGNLEIHKFNAEEYINATLPVSYFKINEKTIHYNLIQDNSVYIDDFEGEIKRDSNYRNFTHYKNNANTEAPRILIFAGSYFNGKEKFITENFSEIMKIHNYRNVIDYEYYINIFNPDIVLFESTEYTHSNYYFPVDRMENKINNKTIENYSNLIEDNLIYIEEDNFSKSHSNLTNFSIPISGDDISYVYANFNGRILDCNIVDLNNEKYMEFSIKTSEIKELNDFNLYVISKDEERYQEINCTLI